MARPRVPLDKAKVTGADTIHAGRFSGRKGPKRVRPIGEPYKTMTAGEKAVWAEMARDMPWLNAGHRVLLRLACTIAARLDGEEDVGVSAIQALSAILSKLGATPVDETKVNHGDGEDEDPTDKFFN